MIKQSSIAVIGLGLIGGSILKALRHKNYNLIAVARREETIQKAVEQDLANVYSTDINVISPADVVFVCTPINKTVEIIDVAAKITPPNCIISDVASLKGFIMDHINNMPAPINFIGGHPMAGTENKGIDYAIDNLFEGSKWVLTPSKWTDDKDLNSLVEIIRNIGAKTIIADPYQHDKAASLISHMPLLLSQGLFGMVEDYPDDGIRQLALRLAASGFRDMTRLAATNSELSKDMLFLNKPNVRESLSELIDYLVKLSNELEVNESLFYEKILKLSQERKSMYSAEGKNIYGNSK